MVEFASRAWIARLDAAVGRLQVDGPSLRVRYRFLEQDGVTVGYDLLFGQQVRAVPSDDNPAGVTITQTASVAAAVADGSLAAQQALLEGSIRVEGAVTELLAWRPTLDLIEQATAALRAETVHRR